MHGGRGCPSCGSHNTAPKDGDYRLGQECKDCGNSWVPCGPGCRGYSLDVRGPEILGCTACGVPDATARRWPEAWRAMAHRLRREKHR